MQRFISGQCSENVTIEYPVLSWISVSTPQGSGDLWEEGGIKNIGAREWEEVLRSASSGSGMAITLTISLLSRSPAHGQANSMG